MRMWRGLAVAGSALLVVGSAVVVPLVVATPPSIAAGDGEQDLVPQELYGDLYDECVGGQHPVLDDYFPIPLPGEEFGPVLEVTLATVDSDDGDLHYIVDPTPEQAAIIAAMNECFARWPVDPVWAGPPQFLGMNRQLYDDYLVGVLMPCLRTQGLEVGELTRVSSADFDVSAWYYRQFETLDLEGSLAVWRACPLIPGYLQSAAYPGRIEDFFG